MKNMIKRAVVYGLLITADVLAVNETYARLGDTSLPVVGVIISLIAWSCILAIDAVANSNDFRRGN